MVPRETALRELQETAKVTSVHVTDITMPFLSMVGFMVKLAIAAIPAALILTVLGWIAVAVLGGLAKGIAH